MEITRGVQRGAQRVCIYGPEGIGKTTLAAQFPNPLFIDTEGSTRHIDVARLPDPTSAAMVQEELDWIINQRQAPCQTLVIDTADWLEKLIKQQIMDTLQIKSMEQMSYGKAYVYVWEDFGRILAQCDRIIKNGINVVFTAHAALRKFEQPDELGAYDRWELKLQNSAKSNICAMLKEWADLILFCNYEIHTYKTDDDKVKASGGQRVMYTSHHPSWDAKNRHGLPEKVPMSFSSIASIFPAVIEPAKVEQPNIGPTVPIEPVKVQEAPKILEDIELPFEIEDEPAEDFTGIPQALVDLIKASGFTIAQVEQAVVRKGYMPEGMPLRDYPKDFVDGCLIGAWDAVKATIV